jgi:hypothetical protein
MPQETVPKVSFQSILVRKKPRLHTLNHKVGALIVGVRRFIPVVVWSLFKVLPSRVTVCNRVFRID